MDPRRAAIIATALTLPFVVIAALLIGNLTGDADAPNKSSSESTSPSVLPAVTVAAPPHGTAHAADCTRVLAKLPVRLATLAPRVVHPHPDSPYVTAWGEPPVVFRCGVRRPAQLRPGSSEQAIQVNGVWFLPVKGAKSTVWTAVDRPVYVEVTVPATYPQPPIGQIAEAVRVLKQVCVIDPRADVDRQCTRRH